MINAYQMFLRRISINSTQLTISHFPTFSKFPTIFLILLPLKNSVGIGWGMKSFKFIKYFMKHFRVSSGFKLSSVFDLLHVFKLSPAFGLFSVFSILPVIFTAVFSVGAVDFTTLNGKVLLGYQGWFNCPNDGCNRNWSSWFRGNPSPETLTVDMYPDLTEFNTSDLCPVPGFTIRGKQAYLYTAANPNIVDRHFLWMKTYGLDGVLIQRFVVGIHSRRSTGDIVLKNILKAAQNHGRAIAIEYDITGANPETFFDILREDWKYLVEELKITSHPCYLHHNGKPVLSIWGMGLSESRHVPRDPETAMRVIKWFKEDAPPELRVTYIGGVPSYWRTLTRDALKNPGWEKVYAYMDVIQPWTVGRYKDEESADQWRTNIIEPDLAKTKENGQLYMPVIFPGFSWSNLKKETPNRIPRNGGTFLWKQAQNARQAGATMLKIAMFDEVNEGTAVYKIAAKRKDAPEQGFWLTLDADGYDLSSDWYLKLSGEITKLFHGEIKDPKFPLPLKKIK